MLAGMGFVYLFLTTLIVVTSVVCKAMARFNGIFPEAAPKKAPAKASASDDGDLALAIAVALNG